MHMGGDCTSPRVRGMLIVVAPRRLADIRHFVESTGSLRPASSQR